MDQLGTYDMKVFQKRSKIFSPEGGGLFPAE